MIDNTRTHATPYHTPPPPTQTRILGLNAQYFLKNDGDFMISLKANCIDSTQEASVVITDEMNKMKALGLKRKEKLSLEPFERDHAVVCDAGHTRRRGRRRRRRRRRRARVGGGTHTCMRMFHIHPSPHRLSVPTAPWRRRRNKITAATKQTLSQASGVTGHLGELNNPGRTTKG